MNTPIPSCEPPNGSTQKEIDKHSPSVAPPGGEDRFTKPNQNNETFPDTGGTMQDFELSSKHVAKVLKNV